MTDGTDRESMHSDGRDGQARFADGDETRAVGTYEVEEGMVFYDEGNPLAWIQSRLTVKLAEMA